eukprot:Em0003g1747a
MIGTLHSKLKLSTDAWAYAGGEVDGFERPAPLLPYPITIKLDKLKEKNLLNILLCSIDVTNMYTNIPIDEGNRAAIRALENMKCATDIPDMTVMKELLDMITHNNVFEFNGEHYIQIRGVPMGNIMAPSYSGIFMGELEKKLIEPDAEKIKLWVRYIDDIFMLDLPDEKPATKREQSPMDSSVSFSVSTENMRMERLLGSLCHNDTKELEITKNAASPPLHCADMVHL